MSAFVLSVPRQRSAGVLVPIKGRPDRIRHPSTRCAVSGGCWRPRCRSAVPTAMRATTRRGLRLRSAENGSRRRPDRPRRQLRQQRRAAPALPGGGRPIVVVRRRHGAAVRVRHAAAGGHRAHPRQCSSHPSPWAGLGRGCSPARRPGGGRRGAERADAGAQRGVRLQSIVPHVSPSTPGP
jgi:hypothetical protein